MKKILLILISIVTMLMSGCGNADGTKKETDREPSTRVPNSVVGKWYEYSSAEGIKIWDFNEKGIFYSTIEEDYGKEDETFHIKRREYFIEGNIIHIYNQDVILEYTSYGLRLIFDPTYDIKLYEYREDAVKQMPDEWKQKEHYESIKDENGCVIEDGVEEIGEYAFADSYYKKIHIPESVNDIGEFAFRCSEGNHDGKIYVKKGSYAEEYFSQYAGDCYGAEIIVEE